MSTNLSLQRKFGTAPVFFTAISTILGAVMFLRFGYAVGNVGFIGTMVIILVGHAVTIPTAMAIAEIATNQKVEGGGEYFIISRSFGLAIGSSIGIALYFSQAISVAFYIIAFSEAFSSFFEYLLANYELNSTLRYLLSLNQTVSIPALFLLTAIVLTKGADLGVKTLYIVVAILFIALVAFFAGQTDFAMNNAFDPLRNIADLGKKSDSFFIVFAIIFPAFTGMTAGVGLSGDLQNPGKSIPIGTLAGTLTGMVIYFFIAYKLTISASPIDLANTDELVMAKIAWQGWWLIPVGLAAATISSALGSIMVAPRTLQAIARDHLMPSKKLNLWLSRGKGKGDDPFNATLITVSIAFVFVLMGGLNAVAGIISMFFMVTYGSLCLISFLQHFAADPSYRPTFKSRWYLSLFGALASFGLMFFMNPGYAFLAVVFMVLIYIGVSYFNPDKKNLAVIFQGVIFQISRQLSVFMQKTEKEQSASWRPSIVCISEHSFDRLAAFDFLRWLSQKYGFGTYIHKIDGYLSKATKSEADKAKTRLIQMAESSGSNIYIDTLISPSYTSAIAQVIQLPGISGTDNNLLMLEFSKHNPDNLINIVDNFKLVRSVDFDVVILGTSERSFGLKQSIHIWITSRDFKNANLMILLAYIILGHREWRKGHIKIFAIVHEDTAEEERNRLFTLIETGQLPISPKNIEIILRNEEKETRAIINEKSIDADLTIIGFNDDILKHQGAKVFEGYDNIGNTVFVNAGEQKSIK